MGSKNRHAKELLPIILKHRKEGQWYVEPFVGGANMIDKVKGKRIGNDCHPALIFLLSGISSGTFTPPDNVSEDQYNSAKILPDSNPLKGFIGFCCSFGGKYFGGYARGKAGDSSSRNYCDESKRNLLKQAPSLKGVIFTNKSYLDITFNQTCVIYNDPPYAGTTKYSNEFDHDKFWDWCRNLALEGHQVYTSEYNAPDDFVCIWEKPTKANFSLQNDVEKSRTEKLFIHESQLWLIQ